MNETSEIGQHVEPLFRVIGSLLSSFEPDPTPEQPIYHVHQQQFDQGYCKYTSCIQCPLFSSFESLTQYIFLFQGCLIGTSAVLHLTAYQGDMPQQIGLRAAIPNQHAFSNFIIMCRIGGLEVRQLPSRQVEVYLISNRDFTSMVYVANDASVYCHPIRFDVEQSIEPAVMSIDTLMVFNSSVQRIQNDCVPHNISESILHAVNKEIYPLHSGVLMNRHLMTTFVRKSLFLMRTLHWKFRPITIPAQGASSLCVFILPENQSIECSIKLERTHECIQLWCGHSFGVLSFIDAIGHQMTTCPLCRASVLLAQN
jgi:hypothetical protein